MKEKLYTLFPDEKERMLAKLADLLRARPEIAFAYAYGSFLDEIPCHDIDLGVFVRGIARDKSTVYGVDLALSLSGKLGMDVDVRVLSFAPNSFLYQVIRGRLIFDNDPESRSRVVEETIRQYLDLKSLRFRAMREAFTA